MRYRLSIPFLLVCALAVAANTVLHINDIRFDRASDRLEISYEEGKKTIRATDTGPLLLCAINRLLNKKYNFNHYWPVLGLPGTPELDPIPYNSADLISYDDLMLLANASHLLPEAEGLRLLRAVGAYRSARFAAEKNSRISPRGVDSFVNAKVATELIDALIEGIKKGFTSNNHETHFHQIFSEETPVAKQLGNDIAELESRVTKLLDGREEFDLSKNERATLREYRDKIRRKTADLAKEEPRDAEKDSYQSPVSEAFCVKDEASKSRTIINNKNVDQLLKNARVALDTMLPGVAVGWSLRSGGH